MSFWVYMLQCRGGSFYVGHTDDLARRIAQHELGEIAGFTRDHLPVVTVWSQEFQTRYEAKAAEKQIKAWSRAEKLALIRGDRERISVLAKERSSPSASSGQAGDGGGAVPPPACPDPLESRTLLQPHPDKPPLGITAIRARITAITEHWLTLRWTIAGASRVVLPRLAGNHRADGLWRKTCFEMFLQPADTDAYIELNLSPSEAWAAYNFTSYRDGMTERPLPRPPVCTARAGSNTLTFDAAVPMAGLPPLPWRAGLTAVIEEEGGVMSYWASAHSPDKADFHHPACLALTVPARAPEMEIRA